VKEHNRLRLERLTARYARRLDTRADEDEAAFLRAFDDLCDRLLHPAMEECAAELRKAGHAPEIVREQGPERARIELHLGLRGGKAPRNVVGFSVLRWSGYPLQILAYLEVEPPPFDIERFARASDVGPERVEQLLVDAIEHVVLCNAP
jgi:hypothetical protein